MRTSGGLARALRRNALRVLVGVLIIGVPAMHSLTAGPMPAEHMWGAPVAAHAAVATDCQCTMVAPQSEVMSVLIPAAPGDSGDHLAHPCLAAPRPTEGIPVGLLLSPCHAGHAETAGGALSAAAGRAPPAHRGRLVLALLSVLRL